MDDKFTLSAFEKFLEGKGSAILIVIISVVFGFIAIRMTMSLIKRGLLMSKMDNALISFFLTAIRVMLYVVLLLFCLQKLSVPLTSMIAVLSALGVAIGLAIQDSISNVANGLVMIGTRPFKVGEYVRIGDEEGTIEELRLMNTILCTLDNRRLILPNKMVFNSQIVNYHANPLRRLDLLFQVDYASDIDEVIAIIMKTIKGCDNILVKPVPIVAFKEANNSSLDIMTHSWINSNNYWPAFYEVRKKVYDALVDNHVTIPFPQVTVSERAPDKAKPKAIKKPDAPAPKPVPEVKQPVTKIVVEKKPVVVSAKPAPAKEPKKAEPAKKPAGEKKPAAVKAPAAKGGK